MATNGILGRKIGMMQYYTENAQALPVTVVQAGPCYVTQIKTVEKDGYDAVQLGFEEVKEKHLNKPLLGHFAKGAKKNFRFLKEFKNLAIDGLEVGQEINLSSLKEGLQKVNISGISKGRGFTGVVKRHGFHGGRKTHGSRSHRIPGSIGCSATPSKVVKGKKLPGQYGKERNTIKNLKIVDLRVDENLILIKGAVPGFNSGIIEIRW